MLAVSSCAHAGMHFFQKAPRRHDVRSEVLRADERWRNAQFANDVEAMEKLLSPDYLGITGNGQLLTRAQQLDRMRNRRSHLTRLDVTDQKVKVEGSIAIVTSTANLEGMIDDRPIHGSYRSMRIYKRVGGAWQMTHSEATPERHSSDQPSTAPHESR